jgi:hypothetical protein
VQRVVAARAGRRPRRELTFTSFGHHGGATESNTAGPIPTQLMKERPIVTDDGDANYSHEDN